MAQVWGPSSKAILGRRFRRQLNIGILRAPQTKNYYCEQACLLRNFISYGCGGESDNEAEILRLFLNAADFVLSIFFFVVLHPLVDVLFSIAQHTVDEAGEHVGHRRDGFWCTQTGSQATELSSQVCLTAP